MQDTIKHIVVSGGGPAGLSFYGAIRESHRQGMWTLDNIQTMHGTSIGSIICTMLCLNYEWEVLDDFLIKRPWQHVFKVDMYTIFDSFQKRGIYDISAIEKTFLPLFSDKDISINVTLAEFYELNHIDLHIYASEIHHYEMVDFSHKTHPDWRLMDAIYCSSALPVAFPPMLRDGLCYCDGGFIANYPMRLCLENGAEKNEIIGIKMVIDRENQAKVIEKSSMLDYVIYLINKLLEKRLSPADAMDYDIPHEIKIESPQISLYTAYQVIMSPEERVRLIEYGEGNLRFPSDERSSSRLRALRSIAL